MEAKNWRRARRRGPAPLFRPGARRGLRLGRLPRMLGGLLYGWTRGAEPDEEVDEQEGFGGEEDPTGDKDGGGRRQPLRMFGITKCGLEDSALVVLPDHE